MTTERQAIHSGGALPVCAENAQHYVWGGVCDGWRLLEAADLNVILERVSPGASEVRHRHVRTRQSFFVLEGTATLELDGREWSLKKGEGLHVPPGTPHRLANTSAADVTFLVISSAPTALDRIEL
jgi:quercetin dioxygenase-like cupin family protein